MKNNKLTLKALKKELDLINHLYIYGDKISIYILN